MTARQIRRAEERRTRKLAGKSAASVRPTVQTSPAGIEVESAGSQPAPISEARLGANRANAQLSTGPRTGEGKAISSRNNLRHGFLGAFCVLPTEDVDDFNELVRDLMDEHQPQTATESILINDMARHSWLTQRALRLQENCFDSGNANFEKQLSLYIRYQTANQRAFHRCLADLLKLRKARLTEERGFESQKAAEAQEERREAAENRKGEMHELNKFLAQMRIDTEETRKFNLDFERMRAAGATSLEAVAMKAAG